MSTDYYDEPTWDWQTYVFSSARVIGYCRWFWVIFTIFNIIIFTFILLENFPSECDSFYLTIHHFILTLSRSKRCSFSFTKRFHAVPAYFIYLSPLSSRVSLWRNGALFQRRSTKGSLLRTILLQSATILIQAAVNKTGDFIEHSEVMRSFER